MVDIGLTRTGGLGFLITLIGFTVTSTIPVVAAAEPRSADRGAAAGKGDRGTGPQAATLPTATANVRRVTIQNPRILRFRADGSVAAVPAGTPVYRNDTDLDTFSYFPPGPDDVADDLELETGPCDRLTGYEIAVFGEGTSGPVIPLVHTELRTVSPTGGLLGGICASGSSVIPGTEADFFNVPNDGQTISFLEATFPTPVSVPDTVWLVVTVSTPDSGWVIAEQAEVGRTEDFFSQDLIDGCLWWFGGVPYAGFWATLYCDVGGDPLGACCNGTACTQETESACTTGGGTWEGAFTECDPNPCLTGACCSGDDFTICNETTEDQCSGASKLFHAGATCNDNVCKPAFPGYVNDFETGFFSAVPAGETWADDINLDPCELLAVSFDMVGADGTPDFDLHVEVWTNDDRGTPEDPSDDRPLALIPGTEGDVRGIRADQLAHTALAGPFPKVQIPEKVWVVFTTSSPDSGPLLGGLADPGFSEDAFAHTIDPTDPEAWAFANFGGFDPTDCPGGASCSPAGSFHITVWCQGDPPTGACCNDAAGTCVDGVTEFLCDGTWMADVTCDSEPFGVPCGTSACCIGAFACQDMLPAECEAFGEQHNFPVAIAYGKLCSEVDCPRTECFGAIGACSQAHPTPGCNDPFCCNAVCAFDDPCCAVEWDDVCVGETTGVEACEPTPANDHCASAEPITGEGTFDFDTTIATTDGPPHAGCLDRLGNEEHITKDVWYCWTAPCNGNVTIDTCGQTDIDSKIAVYDGCGACPPTDAELIACNDDSCAGGSTQSSVVFEAAVGEEKLIRIGTFPGAAQGPGQFTITCGIADNPACPGTGDCCAANGSVGCDEEACCEKVCACDPFCCEVEWDELCAGTGREGTGCGAAVLCDACRLPGDMDGDGDRDLDDWGMIVDLCLHGPSAINGDPACDPADFDGNGTVDTYDVGEFQKVINAP